jgi:tRNA-specific 2-thiouridylase
MKKENKKEKVLIALSGGVDSAVAAVLLQEKGFLVEGIFLDFFGKRKKEATKKAQMVAKKIGIVLHIINVKEKFNNEVIKPFLLELKKGKTPNPCVFCNKKIKFKILMETKKLYKANYIATGHYAKISKDKKLLLTAKDKNKDQTYFLWDIKKEWLKNIIFPLGEYKSKEEVRKIAKKLGIPVKENEDSQEICFAGDDINAFLEKNIAKSVGTIKNKEGKIIGKHNGLFYYTIGQRKGLGLPLGPYYVSEKNVKKNVLVVTKDEKELFQKELFYKNPNFFEKIVFPKKIKVKIRYRSKAIEAIIKKDKIIFSSPQRAVTPGQSVVFYEKEKLLGGGIIK